MIVDPTTLMTPEDRAYQMWSVHPRDLDDLGFTNEAMKNSAVVVDRPDAFGAPSAKLGTRALFYLAHIMAAIDQAVVPLPETDNTMHMLRQFAMAHRNGEPVRLTPEDSERLSNAILAALSALDGLWETIDGRKLTDEEKGLVR